MCYCIVRTLKEATEDLFKVTVVRNPVTKLLSGYRDKVERYHLLN